MVIYRFAVVQSCTQVFPLEMYPAFRPADFTKPTLCSLSTNKGSGCISKFNIGIYLILFCMKKRNIGSKKSKNMKPASDLTTPASLNSGWLSGFMLRVFLKVSSPVMPQGSALAEIPFIVCLFLSLSPQDLELSWCSTDPPVKTEPGTGRHPVSITDESVGTPVSLSKQCSFIRCMLCVHMYVSS